MKLKISYILMIALLMSLNLASCKPSTVQETITTKEIAVDAKSDEIKLLLNDLTTPAKIDNIVNKAIQIPFDIKCGGIHETVMYTFNRYGFYPEDYKDFLLQTLKSIEYPGTDNRAYEIIKYISDDGSVNKKEWEVSLRTVQRSTKHYLSRFLRSLFYGSENDKLPADEKVIYERVDEFFELAKKGKVGLPIAFPFDFVFFEMLDAGYPRQLNFTDTRVLRYVYEKYNNTVPDDKRPKLYNILKNIYLREKDPGIKEKILNWIFEHFKSRKIDKELSLDMINFANLFSSKSHLGEGRVSNSHLKKYIAECSELIAKDKKLKHAIDDALARAEQN
ncbi:MAG: hypothetical protein ABH871_00190 [Pseudomonadota bacterium]